MKEITYKCDRCKATIRGEICKIFPEVVCREDDDIIEEGQPEEFRPFLLMHFCRFCASDILIFADGGIPEPKGKPKKKAATPKPKKKKPVDHGKIRALHEAGWSNKDIADEVKCSLPTVASVLKEEEEAAS